MKRSAFALLMAAVVAMWSAATLANPETWQRQGWQTDFSQSSVPFTEILSGGPPRDGIPAIDRPVFEPASALADLEPSEPLIRVEIDGELRGYPLRVLTWHEIVNDTIAGVPLTVTYCPLCNSAIVFARTLDDGRVLDFGVSGLLRHSDMIMYDRQTESWWQQFLGQAVVGELTGTELDMVPSRIVSFADFLAEAPDAPVLVPEDAGLRSYGRNPYIGYDSRQAPYPFYRGDLPDALDPMARVVVVRGPGATFGVTLAHLREEGMLVHQGVSLSWRDGVASALDSTRIADGRDVGAIVATQEADGSDVVHDITFAFVVKAFHPDITVLSQEGPITLAE